MRDHTEFAFQPIQIAIEILLFSVGCSIIAMSCYTSYSNEVRDEFTNQLKTILDTLTRYSGSSLSFSWAYGLGWASTGVALVGTIISSFGLFMSSEDTGNPAMTFKL